MSMPFQTITCTKCDFLGTTRPTWGRFSYRDGQEFVSLEQTLGWCLDCENLVAIEVLPTSSEVEQLTSDIANEEKVISENRLRLELNHPWWKKILGIRVELPAEIQELEYQKGYRQGDLKEVRLRLSALNARRSAPRCLRCGSTGVVALPNTTSGFVHPKCGGQFSAEPSGISVMAKLMHRVYDLEGIFQEESVSG